MIDAIKYPRTPYSPWSPSIADRDIANMSNFVGRPIVITEKIDGSNTMLHNGQVYGRSVDTPSNAGWLGMVKQHHAWKTYGIEDRLFFGEDIFGIHSIEYEPVKPEHTFYLFGIYYPEISMWQSWSDTEWHAREFGFNTVPVLFKDKVNNVSDLRKVVNELMGLPSSLGGSREGVVIRRESAFKLADFHNSICKLVRENHVQTDEHWTYNWSPCKLIGKGDDGEQSTA